MVTAIGYLLGSTIASIFQGVAAALFHFPGGASRLAAVAAPPWWAISVTLLGIWVGLVAAAFFLLRFNMAPSLVGQFRFKPTDVGFVGLGALGQIVISLAYAPFHLGAKMNAPAHHLFAGAGSHLWLLGILSIAGAPFAEELLFRGVLFRGILASLESRSQRFAAGVAISLSGLLFALAHFELLQLPGLFFVGLLLAYVVYRTGRLLPSIITHASFNAVAFFVVAAGQHGKV